MTKDSLSRIAIVSDELSQDPETALELATGWGIQNVELRGVMGCRVPRLPDQALERLTAAIERFGVRVSALSPGLFKIPLSKEQVKDHLDNLLPESLRLMERLKTRTLVAFGFLNEHRVTEPSQKLSPQIIDAFGKLLSLLEHEDITLCIENEGPTFIMRGDEAAALCKTFNSPKFKINWDPGNTSYSGCDDVSQQFKAALPFIGHFHMKDVMVTPKNREYVPLGKGVIDWKTQIEALLHAGYAGYFTIETHCKPLIVRSEESAAFLKTLLQKK